jgi:hypothetical protein
VEFRPRQEGNTLHLILAPKKETGAKPAAAVKPVSKPAPAPPPPAQGGAQTA